MGPIPRLRDVCSLLWFRLDRWRQALVGHPDGAFIHYVLDGLRNDFRVGYSARTRLSPATSNLHSANLHPEVVDDYTSEVGEGRMLGPFGVGEITGLHVNRMGVVPKGHTPGRWCLITDLSFPEGGSVNDGIQPELCSFKYTSVEAVAATARSLGRGGAAGQAGHQIRLSADSGRPPGPSAVRRAVEGRAVRGRFPPIRPAVRLEDIYGGRGRPSAGYAR